MVPNGCDLELFEAGKAKAWRPEGVAESDLLAVFNGTHGQANGLDAAAELKIRERAGIKQVLVGNGKLKPELMARKEAAGLNNVVFLDQIPNHKISSLLAGANIGIQCLANLPTFYYGNSPNKFFGYAVQPNDAEAFADALEAPRKALVRKGQAALALARDNFDCNKLGARWVDWVADTRGERT